MQLLAATIDRCYRAFVLLGVSGSLRWGELIGLRRFDFDLMAGSGQAASSPTSAEPPAAVILRQSPYYGNYEPLAKNATFIPATQDGGCQTF